MSQRDRSIDDAMVALIKGMIKRGDVQSDIAAFFLINGGRINDIRNCTPGTCGEKFRHIKPAREEELPPTWPASAYELWQKGKWP